MIWGDKLATDGLPTEDLVEGSPSFRGRVSMLWQVREDGELGEEWLFERMWQTGQYSTKVR